MKWGVEFVVVEHLHGPADGGRAEFIVGNAPHDLKSETPAAETFVSGVMGGFAVGHPVDKEADVAAPVGIVGIERNVLARTRSAQALLGILSRSLRHYCLLVIFERWQERMVLNQCCRRSER